MEKNISIGSAFRWVAVFCVVCTFDIYLSDSLWKKYFEHLCGCVCVGKSDEKRSLDGHKIGNDPFSLGGLIVGVVLVG